MNLTQRLYTLGCMLFIWYACMAITPQFFFLFGSSLSHWQFIFTQIIFVLIWRLILRDYFSLATFKSRAPYFLTGTAIIIGCLWHANTILDSSFDGNWYHLDAIHLLKKGWNPIYQELKESETSFSYAYLAHFPKGSWLFGAHIFAFSQEAEIGKASTAILSISCFLVSIHLFKSIFQLNRWSSVLMALLLASNPIQILNLGSFYSDGQLAALISLGFLFSIYQFKEGGYFNGILALLSFALLANTKYNGTAYACIFVLAFLVFLLFTNAYQIKKIIALGMAWLLFTFIFLGYNPFVTNFLSQGHPFYPLNLGTESVFNKAHNYPANFTHLNRVEKIFNSLFAQPDWAIQPKSSSFKKLFRPISFESYSYGNANLAGFGPVVPEVLLVIFPLGLWALFRFEPKKRRNYLFAASILIASVLINPEAWVLRYVPQFWLIILLLIIPILQYKKTYWIGMLAAGILVCGNLVLGYQYLKKCNIHTHELINQVELVKHSHGTFMFDAGWSKPFQYRIEKLGLNLSQQEKLNPKDSLVKPFTGGLGAYFKKRNDK